MTVAAGSLVRLAYVAEATIGTIPATPTWQVLRYQRADIKASKQTDTPDEVRPDGNSTAPVDVGQTVDGSIECLFSYGSYDDFLSLLFRKDWASNVLVNGTAHKTVAIEEFFETGATDVFSRFVGVRINTLDLTIEAKKPVGASFGVMGLESPAPAAAIVTGASYTAATETEVFNAALNVADLAFTGVTNSPVINKLSLRINSGLYANEAVGNRGVYSHGLGLFRVEGSITALFENKDTYEAILNHTTLGLSFSLEDAAGNSYLFEIPKLKLMSGGPSKPGNGRGVVIDAPLQAFVDSGIAGTMKITRTPA